VFVCFRSFGRRGSVRTGEGYQRQAFAEADDRSAGGGKKSEKQGFGPKAAVKSFNARIEK
jgi:hypothetical protein